MSKAKVKDRVPVKTKQPADSKGKPPWAGNPDHPDHPGQGDKDKGGKGGAKARQGIIVLMGGTQLQGLVKVEDAAVVHYREVAVEGGAVTVFEDVIPFHRVEVVTLLPEVEEEKEGDE